MKTPILIKNIFLALLCFLLFWNCAVFNRNNTPLVVQVEEHLIPEETGPKILAAPVYIPLGLIAGVLDLFIIHPIIRIPDAYRDTVSALWTPNPENGYVTRMAFLPIVIVLTPVFFTGDLLVRSSFDVNGNSDRSRIEENPIPKETVAEALSTNNRAIILQWVKVPLRNWDPELAKIILEKYTNDPEIKKFALNRFISSLNDKTFPQYESYLAGFVNNDIESDKLLVSVFQKFRSEMGGEAFLAVLYSKKAPKEREEFYIRSIIEINVPKTTQNLFTFYLDKPETRKNVLANLQWYITSSNFKDYEIYLIGILNKDPEVDGYIVSWLTKNRSKKASETMVKLLLSNQVLRPSLRLYLKAIMEIGVEKDVQLILDRIVTNPSK